MFVRLAHYQPKLEPIEFDFRLEDEGIHQARGLVSTLVDQ